jgi:quercetin 2,3-dioxygenase
MTITIQQPHERAVTDAGWLDSKHSFNFGGHRTPGNDGHGLLLVNNDDRVAPASGFGTHAHRDMEIVTWVLSGTLEHRDSEGNHGVLYPGLAQRMSAGTGIRHSEMNPDPDTPVHFVQMWVLPDTAGVRPGYQQLDVNEQLARGGLVPIHQRDAVLWGARLSAGESVVLPDEPHVHAFVALGSAEIEVDGGRSEALPQGAAARLTDAGPRTLTAGAEGAEVLVWATA